MRVLQAIFWILFIGLSGCTGMDEDGISGEMNVRIPFILKGESRQLYFRTGKCDLKIDFNNGMYGIYSPQAIVQYGGKKYTFSIPRKSFSKDSISASAESLEQDFSISTKREVRKLGIRTQRRNESCTYCGYCYSLQSTTDSNGNLTTTYQFGNSCSCNGTQNVLREYTRLERYYRTVFKSTEGDYLGEFNGKGEPFETSRISEELSSCS